MRGWTSEPDRNTGVQMGVLGQFWFTPLTTTGVLQAAFRFLLGLLNDLTDLPFSKQKAFQVPLNSPDDPNEP